MSYVSHMPILFKESTWQQACKMNLYHLRLVPKVRGPLILCRALFRDHLPSPPTFAPLNITLLLPLDKVSE